MNTSTPQTWTVGHDGSAGASHATTWAITQAVGRDVDIRLVRSWLIPAIDFPLPVESIDEFAPTRVCDDIDDVVARALESGVSVSQHIVRGIPAATLLSESNDGSLVVVGSRGLGGFRRLLLGSVSSQCAAHALAPTVVVPDAAPADRPIERIVVGLDGSDRSQRALAWATDFAPDGCEIMVVGAWAPWSSGHVEVPVHAEQELQRARDHFDEILDRLEADAGATRFVRRFECADPSATLLEEASRADLLVVGQRGHSGLSAAILGSVSTHVLHHSPIPVAVIPMR